MPAEIRIPFAVTKGGAIAVERNPDSQVRQHVKSLVATNPGERVVITDYGVPLAGLLFDPDDELLLDQIMTDVRDGLGRWEPGVYVTDVRPVGQTGDGGVRVDVDFVRREAAGSPAGLARSTNSAVVYVGGNVHEVVRG